jgi:hypothetical protein
MIRSVARTAALGLLWLVLSAHVGSPDTWFEGAAGPYHVSVQIIPAGVIPGVATVHVRVIGDNASGVSIQGDKFDATGGAPPPEPAEPVEGDAGHFIGKLWIMSGGSNSVIVNVNGAKGPGRVVIPVVAVAFARSELGTALGAGLIVMGMFLFVGLVTIVGASVREGSLAPGEAATDRTRRRARAAMAIATVLLSVALFGGWRWWNDTETAFVENMYKPLSATAEVDEDPSGKTLVVSIADSAWIKRGDTTWLRNHGAAAWTPLVADHGKLIHVFVIRDDMSAFAHLHPGTTDSVRFAAPLPPVPAGRYRVFADIVHESGFTQTLVTSLEIAADSTGRPTATGNPDDSWFAGPVVKNASVVQLEDGSSLEWRRPPALVAGQPASLSFEVKNADGSPASLEPYMGMAGHAVVQRSDAAVFVHLHPMGTVSMAAQMAFQMREPGDTVRGRLGARLSQAEMTTMSHSTVASNVVTFPYAFPVGGEYRIWVQVKRAGRIRTAAFDASVAAASPAD